MQYVWKIFILGYPQTPGSISQDTYIMIFWQLEKLSQAYYIQACNFGLNFSNVAKGFLKRLKSNFVK